MLLDQEQILYVGDIHGELKAIKHLDQHCIKNNIKTIIQVGDFGAGWRSNCKIIQYFNSRKDGPVWYTCGGNHEDYSKWLELKNQQDPEKNTVKLANNCYWVLRGRKMTINNKVHLFLGGAESIDRHMRTENLDWWSYETPTHREFSEFADIYSTDKPEIIVTHDAPICVKLYKYQRKNQTTPRTLQRIWELNDHKPKYWYFGHHHVVEEWNIDNTIFRCCGLGGQYWTGA